MKSMLPMVQKSSAAMVAKTQVTPNLSTRRTMSMNTAAERNTPAPPDATIAKS